MYISMLHKGDSQKKEKSHAHKLWFFLEGPLLVSAAPSLTVSAATLPKPSMMMSVTLVYWVTISEHYWSGTLFSGENHKTQFCPTKGDHPGVVLVKSGKSE
jgi:hypothetical protein